MADVMYPSAMREIAQTRRAEAWAAPLRYEGWPLAGVVVSRAVV